jgi:phosphatidate cytidylyltransferase
VSAGHHDTGITARPASARPAGEGALRVLFGLFLAIVATALTFRDPSWFATAIVVVSLFAAREWHRLVRSPAARAALEGHHIHLQTIVTAVSIALAVTALLSSFAWASAVLLALGAVASFVLGQRQDDNPAWHAAGVLYIGIACLSLVALQALALHGSAIVLGLFLIIWATDTGALVFGKLIGGKKLAPAISPGKTWAGTIGGSVTGALVFALYIAVLSFNVFLGFLFALAFSVVVHGGDLFESYVKRRFGTKDSGGLIPGHGGALDRMDSTFAAAPAMALLVFGLPLLGLHFNPLFGGHL